MINKIEKIENEIKYQAFGKTRINRNKHIKSIKKKKETEENENELNRNLIMKQSKKIEDEVIKIKNQNLGRVGNIFKMKEVITGPKKGSQDPTAIKDPITGDLIVSNEEIKKVTLAYCVANLTKKSDDSEVIKGLELKESLHRMRMEDVDEEGMEIDKSDFDGVVGKFAQKKTKSYDFLIKAGDQFKQSIFKVCKKMIDNEEFPIAFRKTILYMIWKQKGPAEILKNSRFIHIKEGYLPRTCEALVVSKMKECILQSSSMYQVGGQPGHSPEEHIFTIKSIWALFLEKGEGLILTLVDIISFFDRENVYDVMQTLEDIGVNKKAARLWYKLNEGTEIAVKTAGGVSETAKVGDVIGQGTAGGALVSQANLDHGLMEYFGDSKDEIHYGGVRIQPLAYQDDVLKGSKNVLEAQVGNIRLAEMLRVKGLEAHPDKTSFIICGSEEFKNQAKEELKENPIMFGHFVVKEKESDKYLGQILHGAGLEESSLATAKERIGRIKGAALEIRSIIEEFQMQMMGGMMAAWELWEKALIPSLLNGSGTWLGNCKMTVDLCDNIQNFFWRVMLCVPESCPKIALRCETRMLGMKWRIWQEKILLLMRIKGHGMNTLCRQVYEEGIKNDWPGLAKEVAEICKEIGISNVNEVRVTKSEIKKAIFNHHYNDMMNIVKTKTKLENIKDEDFSDVQEYFKEKSVENTRLAFKIRTQMVAEIPRQLQEQVQGEGDCEGGARVHGVPGGGDNVTKSLLDLYCVGRT